MNLSENLNGFKPGQVMTMPVSEFTSGVQNDIINAALGLRPEKQRPVLPEGHIAVPAATESELKNYKEVFNAPGVKEAIASVIYGGGVATPNNQINAIATPAPGVGTQQVGSQNQPLNEQGTVQQTPNENPVANETDDFWKTIMGDTTAAPSAQSETIPVASMAQAPNAIASQIEQKPTLDNQLTDHPGQQAVQPVNPGNELAREMNTYNNTIRAEAIRQGADPNVILSTLNGLSPEDVVSMAKERIAQASGVNTQQPSNSINLSEAPGATGPITTYRGIGHSLPAASQYRV